MSCHSSSWVALNFDASFSASSLAGLGFVACDYHGLVLDAETSSLAKALASEMAEALGFRWLLSFSYDLSFRVVSFECDCLQLFVEAWRRPSRGTSSYV